MEEQRRLLKQIQSGNFGMSMYDRVKRRSSKPKAEDEKKKNEALDQLREKSGKKVSFCRETFKKMAYFLYTMLYLFSEPKFNPQKTFSNKANINFKWKSSV